MALRPLGDTLKKCAVANTQKLIRNLCDESLNELLTIAIEEGAGNTDEISRACLDTMRAEMDERIRNKAIRQFNGEEDER